MHIIERPLSNICITITLNQNSQKLSQTTLTHSSQTKHKQDFSLTYNPRVPIHPTVFTITQ